MPAPTSYDETALKTFIVNELGPTGVGLGLTTSSAQVTQAVYAVQRLLSVADVADATDMPLVEAAARWEAWKSAWSASAGNFDFKAGAADLKRSQIFDHIQQRLLAAESTWYTALATSEAAAGTGPSFFAFGTVCGRRGH